MKRYIGQYGDVKRWNRSKWLNPCKAEREGKKLFNYEALLNTFLILTKLNDTRQLRYMRNIWCLIPNWVGYTCRPTCIQNRAVQYMFMTYPVHFFLIFRAVFTLRDGEYVVRYNN